jgi:hypothetical protein
MVPGLRCPGPFRHRPGSRPTQSPPLMPRRVLMRPSLTEPAKPDGRMRAAAIDPPPPLPPPSRMQAAVGARRRCVADAAADGSALLPTQSSPMPLTRPPLSRTLSSLVRPSLIRSLKRQQAQDDSASEVNDAAMADRITKSSTKSSLIWSQHVVHRAITDLVTAQNHHWCGHRN